MIGTSEVGKGKRGVEVGEGAGVGSADVDGDGDVLVHVPTRWRGCCLGGVDIGRRYLSLRALVM